MFAASLCLPFCPSSRAVTILSDPIFIQATNAPLAGQLKVVTDVPARISVTVNDGANVWEKDFYNLSTTNVVPLFGFRPARTNLIQVTAYDGQLNACTAARPTIFLSTNLPADFPHMVVLTDVTNQMEPGYTLFVIHNRNSGNAYITIVDATGQVVWYRRALQSSDIDSYQLGDGNLFLHEQPPLNEFLEMDLLGNTVQKWTPPTAYPLNSHEGFITSHGTIMYLSDVKATVTGFPNYTLPVTSGTSTNVGTKTVYIDDNPIVEISVTNGALLNVWSPLNQMDPTRITYETGDFPSPLGGTIDTEHANAVVDDTNDNSIIVSERDQDAVYKFSRATGKVTWILAPHDNWPASFQSNLLDPVGSPFEWSYAQHAPKVTPQGTIMIFDDGGYRASPFATQISAQDDYSRAVEYSVNETNMTISQVWDSYDGGLGGGDRLLASILGEADWQPQTHNVLTTFGWINFVNGVELQPAPATMARIVEYTHDTPSQVVFDLAFWLYSGAPSGFQGYYCYRSHRIADLYGHPAQSVSNLTINFDAGIPILQFSADPAHGYMVQTSTDLVNWTDLGTAAEGEIPGAFEFDDLNGALPDSNYYRVVTQ